jgi:ribosomal protein S18 acetylase RimI-like enzyme
LKKLIASGTLSATSYDAREIRVGRPSIGCTRQKDSRGGDMQRSHRSDPDPVELIRGSEADIPSLEPLWVAVHHIHSASMPDLAPYVSDEETWRERRELYRELFRKPKTFLFLARARGELVGYALGHIVGSAESWWSDTWHTGDRVGELESISVLPEHRGAGIGSALLDAVAAEFARLGVVDQVIGVLPGNVDAIRLYERRGFRPTWLYLSRFAGRGRTP